MAGGMNKRGSYGSMAERVRGRPGDANPPPGPSPGSGSPPVKHCWVTDRHGRLPALLLEWRQRGGAWHGRVVHPVNEGDGWVVVEEWLPAELLHPADAVATPGVPSSGARQPGGSPA
jgi:hypothetical protein